MASDFEKEVLDTAYEATTHSAADEGKRIEKELREFAERLEKAADEFKRGEFSTGTDLVLVMDDNFQTFLEKEIY